jgi:hypothetical protein
MIFPAVFNLNNLNGKNGFTIVSPKGNLGLVKTTGDINKDGFADILISAPYADPGELTDAGQVYVIFGHGGNFAASFSVSSLNGNNGFAINGVNSNDQIGRSVNSAGDFDGDGYADIILGGNTVVGECYLLLSNYLSPSNTPTNSPSHSLTSSASSIPTHNTNPTNNKVIEALKILGGVVGGVVGLISAGYGFYKWYKHGSAESRMAKAIASAITNELTPLKKAEALLEKEKEDNKDSIFKLDQIDLLDGEDFKGNNNVTLLLNNTSCN